MAESSLRWQAVLAAVAAAAGSAAWVSGVGSAIIALRLQDADLPSQSVVALMPAEHRFQIGASYLLAPLFVGLLGFLADWWLATRRSQTGQSMRGGWRRPALAAATITAGGLIGLVLLQPPLLLLFLAQLVVIVVVVGAVYVIGPSAGTRADERVVVFLLVLVLAGVLAFAFERLRPPEFDFATVALKSGGPVAGYYVTTTSDAVMLITLGDCPAETSDGRILSLPRGEVLRVLIGPPTVRYTAEEYCAQRQLALRP